MPFLRRDAAESTSLPPGVGYTLRLDWNDGSHSFHGHIRKPLDRAERKLQTILDYWLRGPERPIRDEIVAIRREDLKRHDPGCRAPNCEPFGHLGAGSAT